jgi:hypothetical protein
MSSSEVANQWRASELPHISIEAISVELRAWMDDTYAELNPEQVFHDWTDIDDWNRGVEGTSVDTYYPIPDILDASTWAKVSTYRFKNTGYRDENYFYAPIALVAQNTDG